MVVLDETTALPKAPALDPREPPPQILKDMFKRFQKLPISGISTDPQVLDFERDSLPRGVRATGKVQSETLKAIYQRFMGDTRTLEIPEDQPVYSCEALPGRNNLFISSPSFGLSLWPLESWLLVYNHNHMICPDNCRPSHPTVFPTIIRSKGAPIPSST